MNNAYLQFKTNIQAIKDLKNTIDHINKITTTAVDISDLYRSQIVLVVSALDHFIHEYVMNGMIEAYNGNRPATPSFLKFQLPLSSIYNLATSPNSVVVKDIIRERHSWVSFQDPDKIADAIRLISEKKVWEDIGLAMHTDAKEVKTRLKLIVDRRNKIAHEADMNPTYPGTKWPISSIDIDESIDFIVKLVDNLYNITNSSSLLGVVFPSRLA